MTLASLSTIVPARNAQLESVNGMLDLTAPRHTAWDNLYGQTPAERSHYLESLATLLKAGIVGVETLDVGGRPYTRFAELAIGDESHRGMPQYRRLDLRA